MEVRAVTKYVGISPQKTRWVVDQVRGMQAEQALALLRYPWMTARVAQGIYWQALQLWLKKCPFYGHPESAASSRPGDV